MINSTDNNFDYNRLFDDYEYNMLYREAIQKNKYADFEKSPKEFMETMKLLSSQMYSVRIQNYLTYYLNLISTNDKVDVKTKRGTKGEIKCSFLTKTNKTCNIVQYREEDDAFHIIVLFNILNSELFCFLLTKEQMKEESIICKATPSHRNKEGMIRLEYCDSNFYRWKDKYLISLDDLKIKLSTY